VTQKWRNPWWNYELVIDIQKVIKSTWRQNLNLTPIDLDPHPSSILWKFQLSSSSSPRRFNQNSVRSCQGILKSWPNGSTRNSPGKSSSSHGWFFWSPARWSCWCWLMSSLPWPPWCPSRSSMVCGPSRSSCWPCQHKDGASQRKLLVGRLPSCHHRPPHPPHSQRLSTSVHHHGRSFDTVSDRDHVHAPQVGVHSNSYSSWRTLATTSTFLCWKWGWNELNCFVKWSQQSSAWETRSSCHATSFTRVSTSPNFSQTRARDRFQSTIPDRISKHGWTRKTGN